MAACKRRHQFVCGWSVGGVAAGMRIDERAASADDKISAHLQRVFAPQARHMTGEQTVEIGERRGERVNVPPGIAPETPGTVRHTLGIAEHQERHPFPRGERRDLGRRLERDHDDARPESLFESLSLLTQLRQVLPAWYSPQPT